MYDGIVPIAPGTSEELGGNKSNEQDALDDARVKVTKLEPEDLLTLEEVEALCHDGMKGFDDDELGRAEELIRDFRYK